jgi:hypothetical protein
MSLEQQSSRAATAVQIAALFTERTERRSRGDAPGQHAHTANLEQLPRLFAAAARMLNGS